MQLPGAEAPSVTGGLVQLVLVLLGVCLLAVVVLRYGLKRLYGVERSEGRGLRLVGRLALDPRRSLYVVAVEERRFLIGGGDGQLTLLSELDRVPAEAEAPVRTEGTATPSGAADGPRFADVLGRKVS